MHDRTTICYNKRWKKDRKSGVGTILSTLENELAVGFLKKYRLFST